MAGSIREQPPRRSKRLASAAPSVASDEGEEKQPQQPASDYTALRRHMTLSRFASPTPPPLPATPAPISPPETTTTINSEVAIAVIPAVTTPARPNLLRRAFGFLSSPFRALPQQALGELPTSRKRPAPVMESEHESVREPRSQQQAQQSETKPERASAQKGQRPAITVVNATPTRVKIPRGPSTFNRHHRSSLNAISERSNETSSTSIRAPDPTPSRNRTISSVRSKRDQTFNTTPARPRAWIRPPLPREPNADNRLAKLNHYKEMKEHMQSLEKDEEIREMVVHRTKRVKIDDLLYIPHNRPGDPSSTFRVYDDDSDDEMEVDEAVELRKNVFEEVIVEEVVTAQASPPKKERPAVQKEPPQREQPALQKKEQPSVQNGQSWVFPSVTKRQDCYQEGTAQEARLGAIFRMGFEHWKRSGEILPVF